MDPLLEYPTIGRKGILFCSRSIHATIPFRGEAEYSSDGSSVSVRIVKRNGRQMETSKSQNLR